MHNSGISHTFQHAKCSDKDPSYVMKWSWYSFMPFTCKLFLTAHLLFHNKFNSQYSINHIFTHQLRAYLWNPFSFKVFSFSFYSAAYNIYRIWHYEWEILYYINVLDTRIQLIVRQDYIFSKVLWTNHFKQLEISLSHTFTKFVVITS